MSGTFHKNLVIYDHPTTLFWQFSIMSIPFNPPLQLYEGEPENQSELTVTCGSCKLTISVKILKNHLVQYCLVCGMQVTAKA